jgi:NADPH:quinone reductase-like Zn-dependent oxidoreductase
VLGTVGSAAGADAASAWCRAAPPLRHDGAPGAVAAGVMAATGGAGVDFVVDALRAPDLAGDAGLVRRGGAVAVLGTAPAPAGDPALAAALVEKELRVVGVRAGAATLEELRECAAAVDAGVNAGDLVPLVGRVWRGLAAVEEAAAAPAAAAGATETPGVAVVDLRQ